MFDPDHCWKFPFLLFQSFNGWWKIHLTNCCCGHTVICTENTCEIQVVQVKYKDISGCWFLLILKNMKVNGKDDIPYMKWKIIQSCLKPPTKYLYIYILIYIYIYNYINIIILDITLSLLMLSTSTPISSGEGFWGSASLPRGNGAQRPGAREPWTWPSSPGTAEAEGLGNDLWMVQW